jgi:hypothetical protein
VNPPNHSPSFFSIVQADYVALLSFLFPIAMWGLFIFNRYIASGPDRADAASFFLRLAIAATVIGIPLLIWRIRTFQAHFARGVEVAGKVTGIGFRRDRGRIEYAYSYQGQTYHGANAIHKISKTRYLKPGDEVALLVDPDNPKRAFVRDIYI